MNSAWMAGIPTDLSQSNYGRFKPSPGSSMATSFTRAMATFDKQKNSIGEQPSPWVNWEKQKQEFQRRLEQFK
jgi:hypothetical protein